MARRDRGRDFATRSPKEVHSPYRKGANTVSRAKSETLTVRTTPEIKELLRLAATQEHRSIASMVEILILQYAKAAKLAIPRGSKAGSSE